MLKNYQFFIVTSRASKFSIWPSIKRCSDLFEKYWQSMFHNKLPDLVTLVILSFLGEVLPKSSLETKNLLRIYNLDNL